MKRLRHFLSSMVGRLFVILLLGFMAGIGLVLDRRRRRTRT